MVGGGPFNLKPGEWTGDASMTLCYGQLAGAYYGVNDIPTSWRSKLAHLDVLERFAEQLHDAAGW